MLMVQHKQLKTERSTKHLHHYSIMGTSNKYELVEQNPHPRQKSAISLSSTDENMHFLRHPAMVLTVKITNISFTPSGRDTNIVLFNSFCCFPKLPVSLLYLDKV